ncbi:MAG: response regulator [Bacteroidota bacterium]|nr:response regulator [Bacteroidota bacterium]
MPKIRIVIVDPSPSDAYVMMRTFNRNPLFTVLRAFSNGIDFLKSLSQLPEFDCLLIDTHLPKMSGKEVILELKTRGVLFKIYAITYGLIPYRIDIIAGSGIHAYSRKDPELLELLLPKIVAGDLIYDDRANDSWNVNGVDMNMFELEKHVWLSILNESEKAILNGFANGLTLTEISKHDDIDIKTLDKYYKRMLKKLKLKSDDALKNFALENGFGYDGIHGVKRKK